MSLGLCLLYSQCCGSVFKSTPVGTQPQEDCCVCPEENLPEVGHSVPSDSTLSIAPHTPLNPEEPLFTLME